VSLELPLATEPRERPYTVFELVERARALLERALPAVWVEGEISNFKKYPSGHWYFSLKDPFAQIRCVMFRSDARRLKVEPSDGLKVFARGELSVGTRRGDLQLVVRQLLATTEGGFYAAAFEKARRALERDGLLDPSRRRPLPPFPRAIGVVTSPEGAVWRDIVAVVSRRWPAVDLVLAPARVQGDEAPADLVRALGLAARLPGLDVLIVARGGGSKEDLWAFNEERVARAVAASPVPTISAVGHEADVTLTDLVADVRAPTPSAAAEKAVPDRLDVSRHLASLGAGLARAARGRLDGAARTLREHALLMLASCGRLLGERRGALERLAAALEAMSPLKVLERGYSVALSESGRVLRRVNDFPIGREFRLRVSDGQVRAAARGES
jgi:exodeoxyribonuclease VII large subunit